MKNGKRKFHILPRMLAAAITMSIMTVSSDCYRFGVRALIVALAVALSIRAMLFTHLARVHTKV